MKYIFDLKCLAIAGHFLKDYFKRPDTNSLFKNYTETFIKRFTYIACIIQIKKRKICL